MINYIYKPKGERIWRWKFRLSPADGKITDISLGTSDKQVAEKKRGELLREKEHERAGLLPSQVIRNSAKRELLDHLNDFLGDLRIKGRNSRYIESVEFHVHELVNKCAWKRPQDITADSLVAWRNSQKKAPKTLNEYLTSAKGFLSWMLAQGRLTNNPLALVGKVEVRGRAVRIRRALTETELDALLSVAGPQRIVYLTALLTGIRHGEMQELRWSDFNLAGEKPSVTVRASVSKNHKQACLPLHPALVTALDAFRPTGAKDADLAFNGLVPRSKVFNAHLTAAKIAKLDAQGRVMDFHSLRHTFCTNLQCAGVSQREAMELMRHSDPRLTASIYTDASLLPLKAAVEKLAVSPSQIASQISGAAGQTVAQPDAEKQQVEGVKTIENKGEKSISGAAWQILTKIEKWCALQVSNLQKTPESLGNYDSPSQIASQKIAESLSGLDSVVESWPALPPALKTAILSIVSSVNSQPEGKR